MDNLHIHQAHDGDWLIMDNDFDKDDDAPVGRYPTKEAAERALDDIRTCEAERAWERQSERFYG